jgi:hypothetical protein
MFGDKIDQLVENPEFRSVCVEKLVEVMNKEIIDNIKLIKSINLITA